MKKNLVRSVSVGLVGVFILTGGGIAHAEGERVYCDDEYTKEIITETRELSRSEIEAAFPGYVYSDELITTNRVASAYVWRTRERIIDGSFSDSEMGPNEGYCEPPRYVYSEWSAPVAASIAPVPAENTKWCLKDYRLTLAGPMRPDFLPTLGFENAPTLDNPAKVTEGQTTYGKDPDRYWDDCATGGKSYNRFRADFIESVDEETGRAISDSAAKRLMAGQGRYFAEAQLKASQIEWRAYPDVPIVFGSYAGTRVPLKIDRPDSRASSRVREWFLSGCDQTLIRGSLANAGPDNAFPKNSPFKSAETGLVISPEEEGRLMSSPCKKFVLDPENPSGDGGGGNERIVPTQPFPGALECRIEGKGGADALATPVYRSRDARTNAYLGSYRGYSDWVSPSGTQFAFEVRADNRFVWADWLRNAKLQAQLVGDATDSVSSRKWSTIMHLSPAVGANSPSLVGTLTNGGPGPNDSGQPYRVAKQPLDEDGNYVRLPYAEEGSGDGRGSVSKDYERLALSEWYGPTGVYNYGQSDSVRYSGLMVAFSAASSPGKYWGVRPAWAVSTMATYSRSAAQDMTVSFASPTSVDLTPGGFDQVRVTEAVYSNSCSASREGRFDVKVPAIYK